MPLTLGTSPCGGCGGDTSAQLCLEDGTPISIELGPEGNVVGWTNLITGVFTAGNPPAGTGPCGTSTGGLTNAQLRATPVPVAASNTDTELVYDNGTSPPTPFLRTYHYDSTGTFTTAVSTLLDGTTAYVPSGTVASAAAKSVISAKIDQQASGSGYTLSAPTAPKVIRSVSVVVPTGATCSIDPPGSGTGGTAITVNPGTYTWTVDGPGESLLMPMVFTPTGGTIQILWTESSF